MKTLVIERLQSFDGETSSFGIVLLVTYYNNYGLLVIMIPIIIGYIWGIKHFMVLEKAAGNYPLVLKNYI